MARPVPLLALLTLPILTGCETLIGVIEYLIEIDGDLTTATTSILSDSNGIASIEIDVENDTKSFLVTASSTQWLALERVEDPGGDEVLYWDDWYGGNQSLTGAFYAESRDMVFNWPVREEDGPLEDGSWLIEIGVINNNNYYAPNAPVELVVQTKTDAFMSEGEINARVVYADGVDNNTTVLATEAAVERWAEIFDAYGLDIDVSYDSSSIGSNLPYPNLGDEDLVQVSEEGSNSDITIVIGEKIQGSQEYYGVAGSIPGALVAAPRSTVVISALANAGGDGSFSQDDIRLYGETLAHEVSHYMGLFHTVETDFSTWDALDDTGDCNSAGTCEDALGDNLMFPYPVCDWTECVPQGQLTDDQAGVNHRYTGTL